MTKARVNADNASADIQGVTAGTGLSGGGTSGAVTLTNDMATTIDAKGDLVVGTGADTYSRLATGNAGETLVADSSATTGLRWQGNFAAGKNKFINGDFLINQRAFTSITADGYGFDRWRYTPSGATGTYSAETFTLGAAPVAGYEGTNFARVAVTVGNDNAALQQRIESVKTFAGQTVTVSFWAKGTNPTTEGGLYAALSQVFGSGGSPSAATRVESKFVLTANWTRYSITLSVPSISGKTLGTTAGTDYLAFVIGQGTGVSTDAWTLDIWGVQLEAGSTATAFQTATGTLAGELAACQRYFQVIGGNTAGENMGAGMAYSTTNSVIHTTFQVPFRTAPSIALGTGGAAGDFRVYNSSATELTVTSILTYTALTSYSMRVIPVVASGLTAGNATIMLSANSNGKLFASAEL